MDYICSEQRKSKKQLRKKRLYRIYKKGGHKRAFDKLGNGYK